MSRVLYYKKQIVGRSLRNPRFGDTETSVVIDCEDNYRGRPAAHGVRGVSAGWYGGGLGKPDSPT